MVRLAHRLCHQRARVGGGRAAVGEVQGAAVLAVHLAALHTGPAGGDETRNDEWL